MRPWLLVWTGLLLLSLRPVGPVDLLVDAVVAPLRLLGELSGPFALVRSGEVRAAERRLALLAEAEAAENRRLLEDLSRAAEPRDPDLAANRRLVHAQVIGRPESADRLLVRLRDVRALVPGLPVACGDVYVGRLVEITAEPGSEAGFGTVELVTAEDFHVGARVEGDGGEVLMTVGGVQALRRRSGLTSRETLLAVHHPSDGGRAAGVARVHERFLDAEPFAPLSEGLLLGRVRRLQGEDAGEVAWVVEPELDYVAGLFQVVVHAPIAPGLASGRTFPPVVMDANWIPARSISTGDPNPGRSTRKIAPGRREGVARGAAVVAIGARLVGRVARAGFTSSDVSLLGDPGFRLVAVGRFEGEPEPRVLGRLVSLGRDPGDGALRFRWLVRVPLGLPPGAPRRARLFTGSGDPGVPAGFYIGEAEIPLDAAPGEERELLLATDVAPANVRSLFVRRDEGAAP